ncbi:hypothetical protein H5410_059467 [Solanum commersonii]|uniref:F-box associated beta-propeller type 1 domain-containing protein n=1 Tax=Solanum commersonii TaxID=4109 RepID=A0A9J5W2I5_SOLCO|nr:hypothetical protein H5410_059467 [Solanum commersonii]
MELDSTSIASLVEPPVPIDQSRKAFNEIQYSSCNGILLITYANDIIIMWNPATRESRRIPKSKSGGLYNFCYFRRIESYKIFRLGPVVFNGDKDEMDIDIFSTKSNKWKTVGIFPPDYYFEVPLSYLRPCLPVLSRFDVPGLEGMVINLQSVSSWKGDPSKLESLEEDATYVCSHPFVLIISPRPSTPSLATSAT